MPTYEYRCRDCGESLEVVQSFHDDPLRECPSCSGNLKKVLHPVAISFKGSGFYRNDSRSSGGSRSSRTSDGANGSNGSSDGSGTSDGATASTASKSDASADTSGST